MTSNKPEWVAYTHMTEDAARLQVAFLNSQGFDAWYQKDDCTEVFDQIDDWEEEQDYYGTNE